MREHTKKQVLFLIFFSSSDSHIYYFMVYCSYSGAAGTIPGGSMKLPDILLCYLIFMNILAFVLMGQDKYKARHKKWRIPEKTLFLAAILGGSIGSILGMQIFRHKTKHTAFVIGMPCILIIQIILAAVLFMRHLSETASFFTMFVF